MAQSPTLDLLQEQASKVDAHASNALTVIKDTLADPSPDIALLNKLGQKFGQNMATAAEDPKNAGKADIKQALANIGGISLVSDFVTDVAAQKGDPAAAKASHDKLAADFQQALNNSIKVDYPNIDMGVASPAAAPAQQGASTPAPSGNGKGYENTVESLEKINPLMAATFKASAELDKSGITTPGIAQAKASLRDLIGGQMNDAVEKAALPGGDRSVLDAAKAYMGDKVVNDLARNPHVTQNGGAYYNLAVATGPKALAPENDPQVAGAPRELDGISSSQIAALNVIKAIPGADKLILAATQINSEHPETNYPATNGGNITAKTINAARTKDLNQAEQGVMATLVAELKAGLNNPSQKLDVQKFIQMESKEGGFDAKDPQALEKAARQAVQAGASGGRSQNEAPQAPGAAPKVQGVEVQQRG